MMTVERESERARGKKIPDGVALLLTIRKANIVIQM